MVVWNALCPLMLMPLDKHYNEQGDLPEFLKDETPSDMPAALGIFAVIALVAGLSMVVLALFQYIW